MCFHPYLPLGSETAGWDWQVPLLSRYTLWHWRCRGWRGEGQAACRGCGSQWRWESASHRGEGCVCGGCVPSSSTPAGQSCVPWALTCVFVFRGRVNITARVSHCTLYPFSCPRINLWGTGCQCTSAIVLFSITAWTLSGYATGTEQEKSKRV